MNEVDIEQALKDRIENNPESLPANVSWPNLDFDGARPFLEVIFSGGNRVGGALKGAGQILRSNGVMLVNVVVDQNTAAAAANEYADTLAALFPEGLQIAITGGNVVIRKPPDIRKGFTGESDWRVPVVVTYVAVAS